MRSTSSPVTAAQRLAEALGFVVESSGNRWKLSYPGAAPSYLRVDGEDGTLTWAGTFTSEGLIGAMVDVAVSKKGFGLSYPEVWDLCRYVPRYDPREGWVVVDDTWAGSSVLRMLREADKAKRLVAPSSLETNDDD